MLVKRIIIATFTVLVLLAFVRWGTDLVQARVLDSANPQKAELTKQIDTVKKSIAGIPKPDGQLEAQLAQLETELQQANSAIPSLIDGTSVVDSILDLAVSCGVTVTPLQTTDWSMVDKVYLVYKLQLEVKGTYEHIATFIDKLEHGAFETLIVENLDVSKSPDGETEPYTATVNVAVYARS
jgi:Tfp pilus assembly protein PilO